MTIHAMTGVIYPEDDWLIAQLLEHDINAQATSMEELEKALTVTVVAEWEAHDRDLSKIGPAPDRFHKMYKSVGDKVEFEGKAEEIGVKLSLRNVA